MNIPEDGYLLRIFIGESDRHNHQPLYEWIVLQARESGLAGATVLRGVMGFGKNSVLHTAKILRLSEDLPMIVEIVDSLENIEKFLPVLDELIKDGLLTLEQTRMIQYRA
jgi:PII-like signaling protein